MDEIVMQHMRDQSSLDTPYKCIVFPFIFMTFDIAGINTMYKNTWNYAVNK